jgi:hypothetical protein
MAGDQDAQRNMIKMLIVEARSCLPSSHPKSPRGQAQDGNAVRVIMMTYEISLSSLRKIIRLARFASFGDDAERTYWPLFKERFPNCELFWQLYAVPTSKRLELKPGEPGFANRRDGISKDFWTIQLRHYSLFLQFIYASCHLKLTAPSSFADFYSHLGTACDLAEDILLSSYLMILDFKGMQSPILQRLSKEEFLKIAGDYYDKQYSRMYENYHSKGRNAPLHFRRAKI